MSSGFMFFVVLRSGLILQLAWDVIKCENVSKFQKLCDFGLAARVDPEEQEQQYTVCGTPNYIAPYERISPGNNVNTCVASIVVGCSNFPKP